MSFLSAIFRTLFDLVLAPFQGLPDMVTLLPLTALFSVAALYVVKHTSNQTKLEAVKKRIHAGIFEIRLWNDDLWAIFRAQWQILGHVLNQIRLTLVPLLWMLVPFWIVASHLNFHYGYSGLGVGDRVLVTATLKGEPDPANFEKPKPAYRLEAPSGVTVETATLWAPGTNELAWRVRVDEAGEYNLEIFDGSGNATTKSLVSSPNIVRRSPLRPSTLVDQLIYPQEAPLGADNPFLRIEVAYPTKNVSVFGLFDMNWLITFIGLSIVLAFALRGPLGVTF